MKKIITIAIIAIICSCNAMAQQRINDIRKAYSEALALIKEHNTQNCTTGINHLQLSTEENVPGCGKCTRIVDFYYKNNQYDENTSSHIYSLYFIRVKRVIAARPEVYEYLIDPQSLQLMFAYLNIKTIEGTTSEQRLYYDTKEEFFRYIDTNKQSINVTKDQQLYMLGAQHSVEAHAYIDMFRTVITDTYTGEAPLIQGYK